MFEKCAFFLKWVPVCVRLNYSDDEAPYGLFLAADMPITFSVLPMNILFRQIATVFLRFFVLGISNEWFQTV
jgi:hypothetical protein